MMMRRSMTLSGALSSEPESNGGCGSYSMPSWTPCANSSPAMRAASVSAMSMPDDTPAAVTILPCSTTRRPVGIAPYSFSRSSDAQCVVASLPSSRPAAASNIEPVHTDVVHVVVRVDRADPLEQRARRSRARRVANPPGTTSTSADVTSSSDVVGDEREEPVVGAHLALLLRRRTSRWRRAGVAAPRTARRCRAR